MIRAHTLEKLKLHSKDVDSLSELQKLTKEASWFWLDCIEPSEEEMTMIAETARNDRFIGAVKKKQILSQYEKINDHLLISLSLVVFREKLETHPIYVFTNEKIFITIRSKDSSELVNDALKTFQDCVLKVKCSVASSFVISRLFHELTNKNLDTIIALRERIDKLEEKALAKPWDKGLSKAVFNLKRELSILERILWALREMMLNVREGVVPIIHSSEIDRQILTHAINNISRELSFINSYNDALDSILRLQDLGMIHRVERILIYLTLITIIMNAIVILWETGLLKTL